MADRKLIVKIVGDSSSLERALKRSGNAAQGFGRTLGGALGGLARGALFAGGAAAIGGLAAVIHEGTQEFVEHSKVAAQTGAVLKSTGSAAGITQKQIASLALSLSNLSGIDDEVVQAGENVLLSFTNIRNSAGVGNDIFTQATKAAVDFAARTGRDVPQAALLFGKALEDPAKRLTSLARAGVVFSDSQIKAVTALQKSGDLMGAQKLILAELEKRYGGAAKAAGDTLPGKLKILQERFKDLSGELIGKLAPAFATAIGGITNFVRKLSEAQGGRAKFNLVVDGIKGFGRKVFAALEAELRSINFAEAVAVVQQQLLAGIRALGQFLGSVDFKAVGKAIGDGIVRAIQGAAAFLESVDWGTVGRVIVNGIGNFLKGVNWRAVIIGSIRLLVAAIKGTVELLIGAGEALAKGLLDGLVAGLNSVKVAVERKALEIALAIVKRLDFKILGKRIIPGIHSLVNSIKGELADLETQAARTQAALEGALGVKAAEKGRTLRGAQAGDAQEKPTKPTPKPAPTPPPKPKPSAVAAAGTPENVAATTGLPSAKQVTAAGNKTAAAAAKAAKVVAAAAKAQQAQQFRALGFSATGDTIIPGVKNLQKQLQSLTARISGTKLDTAKLRSQLAGVRKVLSGELGKATAESRAKIQELFQTIRQSFDQGASKLGPLTKTHALNTNAIVAGLGLDPDKIREIRGRLSKFNTAGVALGGPRLAGAGAGGAIVVESHTTINLDSQKVADAVTRQQQRKDARNPRQKRGPNRR